MSKNNPGIHMPMPQAKMRPMTEQEKQARIMQFLQQKREQFSLTILNGLCHNLKDNTPVEIDKDVVDIAVLMADKLMEKLYPIKEEESK